MAPNKRPTITDVAEAVGLSIATVSRALVKPEMVSPDTRERILSAVERLGYQPNLLARDLRLSASKLVFVIVPSLSPFFLEAFRGVDRAARKIGYAVLMGFTDRDPEREDALFNQVSSRRADGIILLTSARGADFENQSARLPPIVAALESVEWGHLPTVRIDHVKAAFNAVNYLFELGHPRVAHIPGPFNSPMARHRLEGYRDALAARGLAATEQLGLGGEFTVDSGAAAMRNLLACEPRPTAVFVANDEMAIGAMRAVKEAGLSVPGDISIMGFDDQRIARIYDPPLTTMQIPTAEIGYRSMLMLERVLTRTEYDPDIVLPTQIVVRESTAAYPGPEKRARISPV